MSLQLLAIAGRGVGAMFCEDCQPIEDKTKLRIHSCARARAPLPSLQLGAHAGPERIGTRSLIGAAWPRPSARAALQSWTLMLVLQGVRHCWASRAC